MDTLSDEQIAIAIVANEPAPYRMAVIRRLCAELSGVKTYSLFTNDPAHLSQTWQGDLTTGTNTHFFPDCAMNRGRGNVWRKIKLYRSIARFLKERKIRLILLHGYNDLTRYLLLRWCNRNNVKVALTADSNVLKEGRLNTLKATIKRGYVRHVMRRLDALMPCGTAGKAYFRSYLDHDLPCIIFPFEPDYPGCHSGSRQSSTDPGSML